MGEGKASPLPLSIRAILTSRWLWSADKCIYLVLGLPICRWPGSTSPREKKKTTACSYVPPERLVLNSLPLFAQPVIDWYDKYLHPEIATGMVIDTHQHQGQQQHDSLASPTGKEWRQKQRHSTHHPSHWYALPSQLLHHTSTHPAGGSYVYRIETTKNREKRTRA